MTPLSWRARRFLSLVILVVGLPLYVLVAVTLVGLFERPGILLELAIYIGLGVVWALPFRFVFSGIGRPDPEAQDRHDG
jgi:putative flippase GtrA